MLNNRPPLPLLAQLLDLCLIQLSNWRWSWRRMVLSGMIVPIFSIVALGVFAKDAGETAVIYVLTGNVVLSLMFENLSKVAGNFAFMRAVGTLNYFATLPVHRLTVVLATLIAFFILSLPAVFVTLLFGSWYLEVAVNPHPLLLLVIPLAAFPLAALGAFIGVSSRNIEEAGSTATLLTLGLTTLGPVIIPPDRLPEPLLWLGWLSPAQYAASALRQTLIGPLTPKLVADLLILLVLSLGIGLLVSRRMDWRQA